MAAAVAADSRKLNHFSEIAGFIWQIADFVRNSLLVLAGPNS